VSSRVVLQTSLGVHSMSLTLTFIRVIGKNQNCKIHLSPHLTQKKNMSKQYTLEETRKLWESNQQRNKQIMSEYRELNIVTAPDYFEFIVQHYASNTCIQDISLPPNYESSCSPREFTYEQVNQQANKIAHWAISVGVKQHDVVALYMENCAEFIMFWLGLSKVGATIACINTYIATKHISHAIELADTKHLILSSKRLESWNSSIPFFESRDYLEHLNVWLFDRGNSFDHTHFPTPEKTKVFDMHFFDQYSSENPDRSIRNTVGSEDPLFYIYTSGTTGKSKAALFSQRRFVGAGVSWSISARLNTSDKYYICLPLYHGNGGVVAVSAVFRVGCTMVLREKFSATNFLNDIRTHQCTAMIYIGELWRYIYNQPATPHDKDNILRVIIGNGLRADIWSKIVERFGIELVVEHYGQTEMIAAHPIMNCYNKVGSCGFIPLEDVWNKQNDEKLIRYDVEVDTVHRNENGWCEIAAIDEPGEEIVNLPNGMYKAYTSAESNEKKVYRDVFQKGDLWFRSGDLLKVDKDGFFYFVDRVGDTYRWKGENVSTNEVCEVVSQVPGVLEANVYGVAVPGTEGKVGMALVQVRDIESFDFGGMLSFLQHELPAYAIPLFLRVRSQESAKTSTLKFQKFEYQIEAFHLDQIPDSDVIYYLSKGSHTYKQLTREYYNDIVNQKVRF
jgi:fatty-acyl-CoA synthase